MSELQLSLIVIGAIVIMGVWGYNVWQEARFRRRSEAAFGGQAEDVLLKKPAPAVDAPASRIEPGLNQASASDDEEPAPSFGAILHKELEPTILNIPSAPPAVSASAPAPSMPHPLASLPKDQGIDFVTEIRLGEPLLATDLKGEIRLTRDLGKPVHWYGLNQLTGDWEPVDVSGEHRYLSLAVALQLADRNGPASEQQLVRFCDTVQTIADDLRAIGDYPERGLALQQARELDAFCAEVDVVIGINVVSSDGSPFAGTKIRALAESGGLQLTSEGNFQLLSENGETVFSLCNQDTVPFSSESLRSLTTPGVTLLYDVPKAPGGIRAFERMLMFAAQLSHSLGADIVDDNRRPLNEAGINKIKEQLREIYRTMEVRQIVPGSPTAIRLFN